MQTMRIEQVLAKPEHRYAYRSDSDFYPIITGVYYCTPENLPRRLCYQLTYLDGKVDYVPISSFEAGAYSYKEGKLTESTGTVVCKTS